eukprot:scaffold278904_cov19-Prasinocladus_malaysianus.AAC.1
MAVRYLGEVHGGGEGPLWRRGRERAQHAVLEAGKGVDHVHADGEDEVAGVQLDGHGVSGLLAQVAVEGNVARPQDRVDRRQALRLAIIAKTYILSLTLPLNTVSD